tara:strand:- start:51 stop:746 length:696 start_codon:yes stop_codon:yes gene_type:complete
MKKRPKLEGCNNLQIGVKSILQKINPIKRINEKKKMDNGQPQDINKRQFIKKGLFGVGIGALAALLSKIPFARAVQNINYDNSANAMAVSSDGIVNLPNQSGCRVRNSSQTISTGGAGIKIEYDTEEYDIQNEFDSSTNYRFTATVAGKYAVFAELAISNLGTDKQMVPRLRVNGGNKNNFYLYSPSGGDVASFLSTVVDLSASDYIELFHEHYHGSDRTGNSKLAIHKIS